MNIVILVDSYYPNLTMNGVITRNIVEELEEEHNVSVVTFKDNYKQTRVERYNKTKIYRVTNHNVCIDNYLKNKIHKCKRNKNVYKISMYIKKIFFYIKRNWRIVGIDKRNCKKVLKCIKNILKNEKIDVIIPVAAPYEMIYSGYRALKIKPTMKLIPIQLDFFSELDDKYYPNIMKLKRKQTRIELEKKIIKQSKAYFVLNFLKSSFEEKIYGDLRGKIKYCQHPLIKKNIIKKDNKSIFYRKAKFNIVYTGTLSKEERNPTEFLETLKRLSSKIDFAFHIFHRGDCDDIIQRYVIKMKDRVYNYGSVESDIAYTAMAKSDILVSIGTLEGNQVAGKTFDYISTGKPIIYFYYKENDENYKYFKKYPLALCINISGINYDEAANRILNFWQEFKTSRLCFDEIEKIYSDATPLYVVNKINECIY